MAYKAEALALLIDVNPSVSDSNENEDSFLQKSVTAANMIIQRKMFNDTRATKSEASLILFGTDGTSNQLYEEGVEGYEHITIAKELDIMDLELLKFINRSIQLGSYYADFLDALVVALDHLRNKCMGRKMEQKVILFTNLNSEFAEDKLELITRAFKDSNVNLVFVGPDIEEEDGDGDRSNTTHKKRLTPQQEIGSKCIRHILDEVDGEGVSANDVLPMLSYFESRRRNQVTTFRGPIEIGSTLKINSYVYVKCKHEPPPSWKKSSALAEYGQNGGQTLKVEMQRSYHHNDEDRNDVNKENIAQAYRYGKTLVPMTDDDKKSMKLESKKSCVVLGFTPRENVDRKLYSRNTCYTFTPQPDDEHAAVAFSALCHALEEKNMLAIVRFIPRANTDPKLGFLAPHIKSSYESLVFVSLPFREDIRQYSFPPLYGPKAQKANFEQKQMINGLINNMMLIRENDEDGEEELFKPRDTLNPVTQRYYQCIQYRALNPDQARIPEIEEYILNSVQPKPEMVSKCQVSFDDIKRSFPLQKVSKEIKSVNVFNKEVNNEEPEEKKQKLESNDNDVFSLHGFAKSHVREIDTADPVGSFKILVNARNPETFVDVCEMMKDCTLRLILDSFLDQYYNKAISCLDVMRKECEKAKVSSTFNKLLLQIKEETLGKRKNDFWELLKKESILPISQDIASDSTFTKEAALHFFSPIEEKPVVSKNDPDSLLDDEDDLLDML